MAFRLVNGYGNVNDPAVINIQASGTIWPGGVVDFVPTAGLGVQAAASTSTQSTVFGVAQEYVEGAQNQIKVIPFVQGQIWEADCNRINYTAHINMKHMLLDSKILNLNGADADGIEGVFEVLAITGASTGSGKVLGRFLQISRSTN